MFLVQGLGTRRWQVGALCDHSTELLPHDDLRLLANFEAADEWLLKPGDMLYVPPLHGNTASRFAFVSQADGGVLLFVDGECFECAGEVGAFAERLCVAESVVVDPAMVASDDVAVLMLTIIKR